MEESTSVLAIVGLLAFAMIQLIRRVRSLEEDVELMLDGDDTMVKAKRELARRRVARETERMTR